MHYSIPIPKLCSRTFPKSPQQCSESRNHPGIISILICNYQECIRHPCYLMDEFRCRMLDFLIIACDIDFQQEYIILTFFRMISSFDSAPSNNRTLHCIAAESRLSNRSVRYSLPSSHQTWAPSVAWPTYFLLLSPYLVLNFFRKSVPT